MPKIKPTFVVDYYDLPTTLRGPLAARCQRDAAFRVGFAWLEDAWRQELFDWVQSQRPEFTCEDTLFVWWA